MLLTVKELSTWLNIKPSTLYAWANQAKIPCRKIHGLIRFDQDEIHQWLATCVPARTIVGTLSSPRQPQTDVERLIAAAQRDVQYVGNGTHQQEQRQQTGEHAKQYPQLSW